MKFETIKPGDVLWQVRSEQAGNTTMRRQVAIRKTVASVQENGWTFDGARWPTSMRYASSWRRSPPEWLRTSPFERRSCAICHGREDTGHRPSCTHPKAKRKASP